MYIHFTEVQSNYEVIIEIYRYIFYGIVEAVRQESLLLKNVRQVIDGKERPITKPEILINFPASSIYSIKLPKIATHYQQIGKIYPDDYIKPSYLPYPDNYINSVTQAFDLNKKRKDYRYKEYEAIIEKAAELGQDPTEDLKKFNNEYKVGDFFDNIHIHKYGRPVMCYYK